MTLAAYNWDLVDEDLVDQASCALLQRVEVRLAMSSIEGLMLPCLVAFTTKDLTCADRS